MVVHLTIDNELLQPHSSKQNKKCQNYFVDKISLCIVTSTKSCTNGTMRENFDSIKDIRGSDIFSDQRLKDLKDILAFNNATAI